MTHVLSSSTVIYTLSGSAEIRGLGEQMNYMRDRGQKNQICPFRPLHLKDTTSLELSLAVNGEFL